MHTDISFDASRIVCCTLQSQDSKQNDGLCEFFFHYECLSFSFSLYWICGIIPSVQSLGVVFSTGYMIVFLFLCFILLEFFFICFHLFLCVLIQGHAMLCQNFEQSQQKSTSDSDYFTIISKQLPHTSMYFNCFVET